MGLLVIAGGTAAVLALTMGKPRVSLTTSQEALVQVSAKGFATKVSSVAASTSGRPLDLVQSAGGLVPSVTLAQGQTVTVTAVAKPPSWLQWLVGDQVTATKTFQTPAAAVADKVALATGPGQVPVSFDNPVSVIEYSFDGGASRTVHLAQPATAASLDVPAGVAGGSLEISVSPASWEQIGPSASAVSYFVPPASGDPVALVSPAPGATNATSNGSIDLNFDQTVAKALGGAKPVISPNVPGTWTEPGPDALVFTPSGFGFGAGTTVTVSFTRAVSAVGASAAEATTTAATSSDSFSFSTGPGSDLRLEEILAELHYLPLNFTPTAGVSEPTTLAGEISTMTDPLAGTFSWRWATTPAPLQAKWVVGGDNELLKGALMAFDSNRSGYNGYKAEPETVAQLATPALWQELLQAAVSNQVDPNPYSYVYVTEALPETMTLWENGSVVLTSRVNTGIAGRTTALGTYPIYVRYTVNYMDGTNPDGSKYHDLVHWINYFDGGDAVHGFVRGSYGYPQSLGCVEVPVPTAETAFGDLAVGDLVDVVPA